MLIRVKYMLLFLRRDDLQNTGFNPAIENWTVNWTYILEAVGSLRQKEAFHKITLLHIISRNSK